MCADEGMLVSTNGKVYNNKINGKFRQEVRFFG